MVRPNGWIVGLVPLVLLAGIAVAAGEGSTSTAPAALSAELPVNPDVPFALDGCVSTREREEYEERDCLQAVRRGMNEGTLRLVEALQALEACTGDRRPDLAEPGLRRLAVRAGVLRARLAFGEELSPREAAEYEQARADLGWSDVAPDPAAVARLRRAGITPAGFAEADPASLLGNYRSDPQLRVAFRTVFGDPLADDMDAIADGDHDRTPAAVHLGNSVLVPNFPLPRLETAGGSPAPPASPAQAVSPPLIVPADAYERRLLADLRGLELAREGYFAAAAATNRRRGSIDAFVARLRRSDEARAPEDSLAAEADRHRALMERRVAALARRLGADPLVVRMAGESAGLATELDARCAVAADRRGRWIRTGAGIVTGLVGAAGVVIATGATGTLAGGVTIAAALEASAGAYFLARSERLGGPALAEARRRAQPPPEADERRFRRPPAEGEFLAGREGSGMADFEEWFEDVGAPLDLAHQGTEVEEEEGESTASEPRRDLIPPVLPVDLPEELRELPPLLARSELMQLRDLSLPEIQERLDDFLALQDPREWARLVESDEVLEPVSLEAMLAEAEQSLTEWEERRVLSAGFGSFFIRAELERLPASRQGEVLLAAMGRYLHDRELLRDSRSVDEVQRGLAARLVAHCRAEDRTGDLVLTACTEETALSILLVAALRDAGVPVPSGAQLGVQAFGDRFEAVLYSPGQQAVYSLTRGAATEGVVAPIYHPATFYYGYLLSHGVVPEIDAERHLLIALPDRPMPEAEAEMDCAVSGNVVDRAVEWIGSLLGVRRVSNGCGGAGGAGGGEREGGVSVDVSIPVPRSPLQGGGGGSTGGMSGGGGGSGGGDPLAGAGPRDPTGGGEGARSGGEPGGTGSEGRSGGAGDPDAKGDGAGSGGAGQGEGTPEGEASQAGATSGSASERDGAGDASAGQGAGPTGAGDAESTGTGGSGGFGVGNTSVPPGPDLRAIGRQATELSSGRRSASDRRVVPWRLREDEGMMSGSSTRVMFADNQRALDRFDEDDLFLTLTPAEVEVQRRMLEADQHPIYQAETTCDALGLPPRGVFRRVAAGEPGYRYVFCTERESMVIFRDRADAESYAALSPPDRPLYLSRLATQRLESFEASEPVRRLRAFLDDPNILRELSKDEMFEMAKAAGDLIVFQNAIESALVQSMNELGETEVRGYYYDMHRQVLQAPLFQTMAEAVDRLNRRLASDPLQSLSWANAQPELARQGFFDLYHRVGGMMEWPRRWAELQQRYGSEPGPGPTEDPEAPSLDFLRVLSDPTRVQVDWSEEREGDPSIRDRHFQDGVARSPEERETPTLAEDPNLQEESEHRRGGTGGLGRAGDGPSFGPDEGQRPLQMIHIRITPEDGDPDRQRFPEDNQVRPGGTEGGERKQTEESATRQEALLWLSPETFIQAILSTWDTRGLEPRSADRIPPILRFNERLRELYLRELHPAGVYDNRLRAAMEVFTADGWLAYSEVREAMGGEWTVAHATDTGRFSAAYSGNPPINDEAQIRIPNFFSEEGTIIPADLFPPVREHYSRSILGIFDLAASGRVPAPTSLRSLPVAPGEENAAAREALLRALETVREQAVEP